MKFIHLICWFVVLGTLFALLQSQYAFHFFYIEQNQLFQNTRQYVAENLFQTGGLAHVTSGFLLQFFIIPYMGPAITAALLTCTGFLSRLIVKSISPKAGLFVVCLIPAILLLFIQFDFNYLISGTISFLFTLIALRVALYIGDCKKRTAFHLLMTVCLFYIAGSVYMLYALAATVYELINKSSRNYLVFIVLPVACLIGWGSVHFQLYSGYRFSFLPDSYYHPKQTPPLVIYYSWIALALLTALAGLVRNYDFTGKKRYYSIALQTLPVAGLCLWGFPRYDDAKAYRVKELDYYCRTEQWDKIQERCRGKLTNYLYLCYVNLALSEKEELADKLFLYDQRGIQGLLVNWNRTSPVSILLSDIYFSVNQIALSQEMAFEAYTGSMGNGNPRMLKRLVQTNLIYGSYPVAEKYIGILENTYCYKDWASAHRAYLYNDRAIEQDTLLGQKRKSLVIGDRLALMAGLDTDLLLTAEQNPAAVSALQFAGAFCLLAKDMTCFKTLIEKYYGTEILPSLPESFQEAMIVLYENSPEKWEEYRIRNAVIQRFAAYKKQISANKNNPGSLPGLLNRSYGDTFWFYYMFK